MKNKLVHRKNVLKVILYNYWMSNQVVTTTVNKHLSSELKGNINNLVVQVSFITSYIFIATNWFTA